MGVFVKQKEIFQLPYIPLWSAIIIICLLSLCYLNSYNGEFVFDDIEAVVNNDDVKDTPIISVFNNDFWGTQLSHKQSHKSYRPLTILSFRLQYWIRQQLIPEDYHIFNIALHIITSILVLFVFNVLLGTEAKNLSFYAAALFAVHPVHTEAVSGIVGRAELLSAIFIWLSILFYNCAILSTKIIIKCSTIFITIVCTAIAMLCKETGITAIGICLLYDLFIVNKIYLKNIINTVRNIPTHRGTRNFIKLKYNFLIRAFICLSTTVIFLFARLYVMDFTAPVFKRNDNPTSFLSKMMLRAINYNYIYCINMWILICPEWLCFDWSMGCIPLIKELDMRIGIVCIFWIILTKFFFFFVSNHNNKLQRSTIIGIILLIIPFLPASNLLFNVGFVIAERTLYIPTAGYCLLVAIGLQELGRKILERRSSEWKTESVLFKSALHVCPLNAKVHYNIAKNAADNGNVLLAKLEYEEALRLNSQYAQAMNNLSNLLKDEGKFSEAEKLLKKAVKYQNDFATAWMNLGIVYSAQKKYEDSENSYLTALMHRPKYADCYYNLGVLYFEQKIYKKALMAWTNASKLKPTHRRAWTNLILLLDDLNMPQEAIKVASEALNHIPNHASIYFNIANILGKANQYEEAENYFKKAIMKDPHDAMFYTNLGVLYHRWNKLERAEEMYKKALTVEPNLRSANENLKKLEILKLQIK
ncbi:protein O-mannosyl-transferase TMTC4 isoform X2 [Prorops nasuta]|uniref:protein O-mannosyl-transferase TMTC4 isoform X2 n=1 Tax=Prorops nasuta TaxID=863751 RepID=UPI0034CF2DE2